MEEDKTGALYTKGIFHISTLKKFHSLLQVVFFFFFSPQTPVMEKTFFAGIFSDIYNKEGFQSFVDFHFSL